MHNRAYIKGVCERFFAPNKFKGTVRINNKKHKKLRLSGGSGVGVGVGLFVLWK